MKVPLPPSATMLAFAGDAKYVQALLLFCVTLTVWFATVIEPVRELVLVFGATE